MDLINSIDSDQINDVNAKYLSIADVPKITKNKQNMFIYQMNIRSLSNLDQFLIYGEKFIREIQILILTETWSSGKKKITHSIPGFSGHYTENFINQNSGVAVFVRSDVNIAEIKELEFSFANCLQLEIGYSNKKLIVLAIYRSPQGNREAEFTQELNAHLRHLGSKIDHVLILGDLNIDILPNNITDEGEEYFDTLSQNGLLSKVNNVTRPNSTNHCEGSCIDHIFSSSKIQVDGYVIKTYITDHYSTLATVLLEQKQAEQGITPKTTKELNNEHLRLLLSQIDWTDLEAHENVNNIAEAIFDRIGRSIENATTVREIPHRLRPIKPWITPGLVKAIRKRDNLARKCKQTNSNHNNDKLKRYYIKYRNGLNKIIKETKNRYYETKVNTVKENKKKLWYTLNEITNRKKEPLKIHNIEHDGITINALTDADKIADIFNSYFVGVGEGVANTIVCSSERDDLIVKQVSCQLVRFKKVTEDQVIKYINSLRGGSGPGADGITVETLKTMANEIVKPLTFLINKSLQEGIFPEACKLAIISPIYKGNKKTDVQNYRPIALQSNISKIIEKCVKSELSTYLEDNNLLPDSQYGFRDKCGTEDALLNFSNHIRESIAKNKKILVCYLDLQKAFDSIQHVKLLEVLSKLGIQDTTLAWFRSYLADRVQKVKVNGVLGGSLPLGEYSIIQGTVVSPTLFNCFVSSLPLNSSSRVFSFADDTALCYEAETWDLVHSKANEDLRRIKRWFDSMSLKLNASKTCYTTFSINATGQPATSDVYIHSCPVDNATCNCPKILKKECVKYLGVLIDQHLKFKQHIMGITNKIRYISSIFIKLNNIASINMKKMLYYALIQSIVEYGLVIWGGSYMCETIKVEKSMNMILRIILNKDRMHSAEPLYKMLKILNFKELYLLKVLKFSIKYVHRWEMRPTPYSIRANAPVLIPQIRNQFSKNTFLYHGALLYNKIPLAIRNLKLNNVLHKKIAKEWIVENFNNIEYIIS